MPKGYFKPFTKQEEEKIKKEFLQKPVKRLADELGCTFGRIMRFLKRNDLEIPRSLIEQRKKDSYKKKGHVPFNKGLKQTEYMSKESIEVAKKTRFKKGRKPHNTLTDGVIVKRFDAKGRSYQFVRLSCRNWQLLHRFNWEKVHGPIPENYMVVFKDGNTLNAAIENLECISQTENMYRNSRHNYPEEIIPSLVLNKQLEHKLKQLQNG